MIGILLIGWCFVCLAEHGYSVSGTMKYPKHFQHYEGIIQDAPFGGHLSIGEHGTLNSSNPFISNMRCGRIHFFDIGSLTSRAFDEPMTDYCYCAESIEVAPDFKSVIFHLRAGVMWDQGYGELTVEDVVFSLKTWKKYGSVFTRSLYATVEAVDIIDKKTVRFRFKESAPTLPNVVGGMPLLCKKFYDEEGIEALYNKPMVALGPYRLEEFKKDESLRYGYRKDFWGRALPIFKGLLNYQTITVRYYQDAEVMRMALVKGDIDSVIERDPVYIALQKLPGKKKEDILFYQWNLKRPPLHHFIVINVRKAYLKDVRVRQALYFMFRYDILEKYCLQGVFAPITSLFMGTPSQSFCPATQEEKNLLLPYKDILAPNTLDPFQHKGHRDSQGYRWRLQQALKLLAQAGWVLDRAQKRLRHNITGQCFPPLHIYCHGAREKIIADDYKERLSSIGITLVVHKAEMPYLYHIQSSHTLYDFVFLRYPGTYYPGLGLSASLYSTMAHKKGSRNYGGICHPAVDGMLDKIREAKNIEEQNTAARALDRVVMHEYYFIPLFYTKKCIFWAHKRIKFPPFLESMGYILMSSYIEEPPAQRYCS